MLLLKQKMSRYLICLLFAFFPIFFVHSQSLDSIKITGNFKNTPFLQFLDDTEANHKVVFYYEREWFDNLNIEQDFAATPLPEALNLILSKTPFLHEILPDNVVVFMPKEKVAIVTGKMDILVSEISNSLTVIGNVSDIGKYRRAELRGRITGGKNNEPIVGATLRVNNTTHGTTTDFNGYYAITLPTGLFSLSISSVGYEESEYQVKLISSGVFDIEVPEKSIKLEEVKIKARRADRNVASNQMSIVEMDRTTIKQLPNSMGMKDILKSMTMIPGIKSVGEFGADINVRGGGGDQNLLLIEGVPVFNIAHIFGLVSVINADAVGNVSLYKGDIPAKFGERVSSVMDIDLKKEKLDKVRGGGGIGLIDSRLTLEVPVIKNKLSVMASGRANYSDWLLNRMPDINLVNSSAKFYDGNMLLNWTINNNNKVSAFYYQSYDKFNYNNQIDYQYGNRLMSLKWNHNFSNNLFSVFSLNRSNYNITKFDKNNEFEFSKTLSTLDYSSAKLNFTYTRFAGHTFDWGIQSILYQINPGELLPLDEASVILPQKLRIEKALENALYISDQYDISDNWSINAGLRFSLYSYLGPNQIYTYLPNISRSIYTIVDSTIYKSNENIKTYSCIEPRLSVKYQIDKTSSVKMSYNRSAQYISLISYSSIPTPDDRWKLSDPNVKPILSNQIAAGYFRNFSQNTLEASVEVYYKKLNHLIEYKNGATINMNPILEASLLDAQGQNYGIEFYLKKNSGRFDGWLSYAYSRSLKKTKGVFSDEQINKNGSYPSNYDKPHELTVMCSFHANRRWRLSANFNFATGRSITLPEYKYYDGKNWAIYYSDRNKYRLPDYHRLDIAISFDETLRLQRRWKSSWTFSLINVYRRHNAYSVFYRKQTPNAFNDYRSFSMYKLYIIGKPFPTLTYNFIF